MSFDDDQNEQNIEQPGDDDTLLALPDEDDEFEEDEDDLAPDRLRAQGFGIEDDEPDML